MKEFSKMAKLARTVAAKSYKFSLKKTTYCHKKPHNQSQKIRRAVFANATSPGYRSYTDSTCSIDELDRKNAQRSQALL